MLLLFDCGLIVVVTIVLALVFGVWFGLVFFVLDLCCVMMLFAWVACGFWVGVCL